MRCDTCQKQVDLIMRVVVASGYNRSLARPIFNCPTCFENKEKQKSYTTVSDNSSASEAENIVNRSVGQKHQIQES